MLQRQVRYNTITDTAEQERMRYRWIFAIVNSITEVKRIKERIIHQLAPVSDLEELIDYLFSHSRGLHCYVFAFSSEQAKIKFPLNIYSNLKQFKHDRNLSERAEIDLIYYVERLKI